MNYGISYASRNFKNRLYIIEKQGKTCGFFDNFKCYTECDLSIEFKNKHNEIFNSPGRGGGWWIWKPHIIYKKLQEMKEDDTLTYIDAGCTINTSGKQRFNEYIDMVKQSKCGMLRFEITPHKEKNYTNLYTYKYFDMVPDESIQLVGGIILLRKTDFTMKFFETIDKIENDYLYTDKYTLSGECHRHDQSIMSLLYKKMKGNLIIPRDETYFKSFGNKESLKYPFWATRKK